MKQILTVVVVAGAFLLLSPAPASAQAKLDPQQLKKLLEQFGGGGGAGGLDPAMLKKLLEQFGGAGGGAGGLDPAMLQKLLQGFGGGKGGLPGGKGGKGGKGKKDAKPVDPPAAAIDFEATFKKLDTNSDGKLSKSEFSKLADELDKSGAGAVALTRTALDALYDSVNPGPDGMTLEQFKTAAAGKKK